MTKKIGRRHGGVRMPARWTKNRLSLALAGLGLIGIVGVLGGCSSQGPTYGGGATDPKLGNPDEIPDAVPRVEPKSKYGNMDSYVVRGRRYYTKDSSDGHVERGLASWYGPYFHRRKTSSGERYDMYAMTAAHKTLPLPTYARVTNVENGRSAVVKINDRGPFHDPRIIDLSYAAATKLGVVRKGTAMVEVRAIDPSRPDSDPGPFLASKKASAPAPLLADNAPRSGPSMFGDDEPWTGRSARSRNERRSPSASREDELRSSVPVLAGNLAPSRVSLEGEDDWLEGTRIVEESTASFAAREESFDASPEPELIARAETRERAYKSALAALDATPYPVPGPVARAEPAATRSAPRVSAPMEGAAAPVYDAPALAIAKPGDRVSAPIARAAAPIDDAPKRAVAVRGEIPEGSATARKVGPKVVLTATKDAPKVAVVDNRERHTDKVDTADRKSTSASKIVASEKKDASRVAAAGKKGTDAGEVLAAKKDKTSVKDTVAKKDAAKVAASGKAGSGKKDGTKVTAASKTDVARVAATVKKDGTPAVAGKGVYLQVGAFGDRGNAERLRKRLSPHVAGQVRVQSPASPGSSLYKVRVGPFGSEGEARKASAKLASLGVGESRRVVN